MRTHLSAEDISAFEPEAKIGLLATIDDHHRPHVTLITSLMGRSPTEMMWGQFCEGRSKGHVRSRPETGFLVMSLDRRLWTGRARWTGAVTEGEEFVRYNQMPMFRYNAYLGVHTVHFMDLVEVTGPKPLSMPAVAAGAVAATVSGALGSANRRLRRTRQRPALNGWTRSLLSHPATLKFLAWIDDTGFPVIAPVVPTSAVGTDTLFVGPVVGLDPGLDRDREVALFGLSLQMESVLVRGRFSGVRPHPRHGAGLLEVDWIYNSMPPVPGEVYPRPALEPIRDFSDESPPFAH